MVVDKFHYTVRELTSKGLNREWWRGRIRERVIRPFFEYKHSSPHPKIPEADWDNLLLLDACRYDLFEDAATDLPGELFCRVSHASATPGYLEANFSGETHHDIVYITANPFVNTELPKNTFHDVIPVWKKGWDDQLKTVPPEAMLEPVRSAIDRYENKRILAHFVQPHYPFIGDIKLAGGSMDTIRNKANGKTNPGEYEEEVTPFDLLQQGEIGCAEVMKSYRSNLKRALPVIETLLEDLKGRTVVTSDHGNAMGEIAFPFPVRFYGHPRGIRYGPTVQVPWLVNEKGQRREISSDAPVEQKVDEASNTADRLKALGYIR